MARVILSVLCGLLVPGLAGAQPATSAEVWRTPWGDPDLQGAWTNTTTTPFQRPFTDEERALSATSGMPLVLGAGEQLRLVERFTRVGPDAMDYAFTVTDPTTYAAPWRASIPMTALDGTLFEYACHEGNYGLLNILRGARARDGSR